MASFWNAPQRKNSRKITEKEALELIVQPELNFKDFTEIFLEEDDFNQVLKRIISVPGWREDTQLVNMFLNVPFIEEDMEIVPIHVYFPAYPLPDLSNLPEAERKLTILVFSFVGLKGRSQEWKRVYEGIYEQIYAVENWKQSVQLVYLHQLMKEEEEKNSFNVEYYGLLAAGQRSLQVQGILNYIERERNKNPIATRKSIMVYIYYIRACSFWSQEEPLQKLYKQLVSEYRILRLRENGNWKDRIQGISETKESSEDSKRMDRGQRSDDEITERFLQPAEKAGVLRSLWNFFRRSKT